MPSFETLPPDLFYPQNLGSAVVSHILNVKSTQPQPGETILDMCAAPGGKTVHIATLMHNTGRVVALDKSNQRLQHLISKRYRRSCKGLGSDLCGGQKT